jgi:DNA polymerase IV (DinB-like DNA polymerase)
LKHFVGCAGWRFGNFYPPALAPKEYLSHYSRTFEAAEVSLPATYLHSLERWKYDAPDGFRFVVRIPSHLTEKGALASLLEAFAPIEEKTLAVVVQTLPGTTLTDGKGWLERVLATCTYHGYSAIVDFMHPSWFQDAAYNILRRHNAAVYRRSRSIHAPATSDFVFMRLAGSAGNWKADLQSALGDVAREEKVDMAIFIADNPAGANAALRLLGLPERKYSGPLPAPALPVPESRWHGRVVMCVDLNAFYPSCEELREPGLRGRPHAVIMTDQPAGKITRGVVSSCSYEARRFGVRSAMPLARALALCPDMELRPVDIPYYKQVSERVMEVLAGFADVIEQASIDEAFLDCTDKAGESPYQYAQAIKRAIKERCGLSVSIGVAGAKSAAKIASDFKKPDGITAVHPDRLQDFLAPLEVGRISGIGPKTQDELRKLGITTIGHLGACDVQRLVSRFGRNGLWMWKVATGEEAEPVVPREDYVSISTEHSLEIYARGRDEVLAELKSLAEELFARVASRGYLFRTVGAKIVKADFTETRCRVT